MIRYRHFRIENFLPSPKFEPGGVTVAFDDEFMTVGVAVCSKLDQFSKKKGREIAESRLHMATMVRASQLDNVSRVLVCPKIASRPRRSRYVPRALRNSFEWLLAKTAHDSKNILWVVP